MKKNAKKILQITLPWMVAVGLLYWLFQHYPISSVISAVKLSNIWLLLSLAVAYFFCIWCLDCLSMSSILKRFTSQSIPWTSFLGPRAATYLLAMVNYGAGQAALGYHLQKHHKVGVTRLVGLFFISAAIDIFWLVTLTFAGSFFRPYVILGVSLDETVRIIAIITYTAVIAHLIFWGLRWDERVKGEMWQRAFAWLKERKLFSIFHQARFYDYVHIALGRLPIHLLILLTLYGAMYAFHAQIAFHNILGSVPISMLIGAIPISWGGVGTTNKALVDLLGAHIDAPWLLAEGLSPQELVFSISLVWMFLNYGIKLLVGLYYLPKLSKPKSYESHTGLDQIMTQK